MLASIFGGVPVFVILSLGCAGVQGAVKRFPLIHPELEIACFFFGVAGECDLWLLLLQLVKNLAICDVANLIVLIDDKTLAVADPSFSFRHHSIACLVRGAYIAVHALPALFAVTVLPLSWEPVLSICQRAAQRLRAVISSKSKRT